MTKKDAIKILGSANELAGFLNVELHELEAWPETIPEWAFRQIIGGLLLSGKLEFKLFETEVKNYDTQSLSKVSMIKKLYRSAHNDSFFIFLVSEENNDDEIFKMKICEKHVSNKKVYIINNYRSILGIGYYEEKVLEPSLDNSTDIGDRGGVGEKEPKTQRRKSDKQEITLKEYLTSCQAKNKLPIPAEHCVFNYADKVGIPEDFLLLAWKVFKEKYTSSAKQKKYKDWTLVFNNAVKGNWFRLWFINNNGQYSLTTTGLQAKREFNHE